MPIARLRASGCLLALILAVAPLAGEAQDTTVARDSQPAARPAPRRTPWYERLSIRGYAQLRYNRLLETNERLTCQQCDRSIGENGGFFLRRGRLVISGDVHERVSVYLQPDYASDAAGVPHFLQLRDAYFDLWLDGGKQHRLRFGQSKIPFGFENLQSSSNRLPLDRNDALNSALPNERDIGLLYYFNTRTARERFKVLTDSGLKGSGDYGVVGIGAYNGQTANRPEANDNLHTVAHLSYPFRLGNGQFIELSAHGYRGQFVIPASQRTAGYAASPDWIDERVAGSFVLYPQPFGLQAEWNVGRGPGYDSVAGTIRTRRVEGGYVQAMVRLRPAKQVVIPFVRWQTFDGAKKLETDARAYDVEEIEAGIEWLPVPAFELTTTFVRSDRRTSDRASVNSHQKGQFLRLQAQFNY